VFYLWNTSPHFAMLRFLEGVSLQRSDDPQRRSSKLVQPQSKPDFPQLFPPVKSIN
jgi:hypothetical protein